MRHRIVVVLGVMGFAVALGFVVGNRLPDQLLIIALAVAIGVVVGVPAGILTATFWLRAYSSQKGRLTAESVGASRTTTVQAPHGGAREFDLVGGADLIEDENYE